MEWVHDLGGRTGLGAVEVEADEPVFHEPWERTARALVYAAVGGMADPNVSAFRHAIERMDPEHYLTSSYYEHWLTAAATLAVESGATTPDELESRAGGGFPLSRPAHDVDTSGLATGAQRFAVGDRVRVRERDPLGHTRAPSYVRGRSGVVMQLLGAFSLPDVEAHSAEHVNEASYSVRFSAQELWGPGADEWHVNVGLWDSYLEEAP